ncbi:MAG: methylmalonyl-CoA mutase family protein, partial [Actinomycetota bacterium]|nr:methylmalonyl-CoA mutase family protein [Actinomycetota bacterium]
LVARQEQRVQELRSGRDAHRVEAALKELRATAEGDGNLLYPMKDALAAYATVGEVSDVLREAFGVYQPRR